MRYNRSEKGRARSRRYRASEKGRRNERIVHGRRTTRERRQTIERLEKELICHLEVRREDRS